jgi:adenylate cyclase
LFSDIRGFTTLTEQLGAHGTVSLLNEYFSLMVDCIQAEGGMLDKFIGDAIMAGFGVPIPHDDDADRALRCSLAMMRTLAQWNTRRLGDGKLPVNIGIGLNTDVVVSGNIGSAKRQNYTLIGDGVNLASRLESACKEYGAKILISEFTFAKLRGTYRSREIDLLVVQGKTEPVGVYEILDFHTEESFPHIVEALSVFKDALAAYRARKWDRAVQLFEKVLALHPEDKPSKTYIQRAAELKANPPPDEWRGVWVMTSK